MVFHGAIPDDLQVLHECDNPPCANPAHLKLGTNADNVRDRVVRGREGDRRGHRNGAAILDERAVREMREAFSKGESGEALGRRFGVSAPTARDAVNRTTWRHVQ